MATRGRKPPADDVPALTLEVLRGLRADMRDGLAAVRSEIAQTNLRLDKTNERLDRLERRQAETEIRLSTEIVALAQAVGDVRTLLQTRLEVRDKVVDHEHRLSAVEKKLGIAS